MQQHTNTAELDAWNAEPAECEHPNRIYEQHAESANGWRVCCGDCGLVDDLDAWTAETARGPQAYALVARHIGIAHLSETDQRKTNRWRNGARVDALDLIDLLAFNGNEAADLIPASTWAPGPVSSKGSDYVTPLEVAYRRAEAATKRRKVRNAETLTEHRERRELARLERDRLARQVRAELAAEGWRELAADDDRDCEHCGGLIASDRARFCSNLCRTQAQRLRSRTEADEQRTAQLAEAQRRNLDKRQRQEQKRTAQLAATCANCGASLAHRLAGTKTCSTRCRVAHLRALAKEAGQ